MGRLARSRPAGLAVAMALLTASTGHAAVYTLVQSGADAVTVMDPAAIERLDGGLLRAWSVTVKRILVSGGPPQPGYVRTINDYDCQAHRLRWRSFTVYSRYGAQVLKQDNPDTAWGPTAGGGEGDAGLRVVCDGVGGGSVVAAQSVGQLVLGLMSAWDASAPMPPLQVLVEPPKPLKTGPAKPKAHKAQP